MLNVTLVKWVEGLDFFRCTVADMVSRIHTIEMPRSILAVIPNEFKRGSDAEHVGIIAAGTVLLSNDVDERFHKVDSSIVSRAYAAASKVQILGRYGND